MGGTACPPFYSCSRLLAGCYHLLGDIRGAPNILKRKLQASCLSVHWVAIVMYSALIRLSSALSEVRSCDHLYTSVQDALTLSVSLSPKRLLMSRPTSPDRLQLDVASAFHDWPTHGDCFLGGEVGIGASLSCSQATLTEHLVRCCTGA